MTRPFYFHIRLFSSHILTLEEVEEMLKFTKLFRPGGVSRHGGEGVVRGGGGGGGNAASGWNSSAMVP
ncbi:hypothetical protein E2C01_031035 [Portunus trituberculatus]|uniref:Uncharacterized protein n=1 Tax=Portunus trituberculatus TaxID=210409 RepID=A0A5B7EX08_PORTR|nr:hypothetical protein [Portunus trituberculatus]